MRRTNFVVLFRGLLVMAGLLPPAGTHVAFGASLWPVHATESIERPLPMGPWSINYERQLSDVLSAAVARSASEFLVLNSDEVRKLDEMIEAHRSSLAPKLIAWTTSVNEWNRRFDGMKVEADPASWLRLCADREGALAPLADQQAAAERDFVAELRATFFERHRDHWARFEYALERARCREPGNHIDTGSIDLVGIVEQVLRDARTAAPEGAQPRAVLAQHCERYVQLVGKLREQDVRMIRSGSRRMWRQRELQGVRPETWTRNEPIFRVADDARRRIGRVASDLAALNLSSFRLVSETLPGVARAKLQRKFWTEVAERSDFVFWPQPMDQFRDSLQAISDENERQVIDRLFDVGYRAALDRIVADEAWLRALREAQFGGNGMSEEATDSELRRRQELGCAALNLLCGQAIATIDERRREGVNIPKFRLPAIPDSAK